MTDAVVWISPCGVPSYTTAPPYWPAPGRSPGQGGGMDALPGIEADLKRQGPLPVGPLLVESGHATVDRS